MKSNDVDTMSPFFIDRGKTGVDRALGFAEWLLESGKINALQYIDLINGYLRCECCEKRDACGMDANTCIELDFLEYKEYRAPLYTKKLRSDRRMRK